MRYSLRRNLYRLAGLGIAPDTRRTMMQCKTAESADLDTLIARPCIADLIQNEFHGKLHKIGRAHSELQSLMRISYAVLRLKKKNHNTDPDHQKHQNTLTCASPTQRT